MEVRLLAEAKVALLTLLPRLAIGSSQKTYRANCATLNIGEPSVRDVQKFSSVLFKQGCPPAIGNKSHDHNTPH
jgi:hypothetical protein